MTLKELVKEDINDLPDFAVGAVREFVLFQKARCGGGGFSMFVQHAGTAVPFRVDRQWLASMDVKPNAATAEDLVRADRDARG